MNPALTPASATAGWLRIVLSLLLATLLALAPWGQSPIIPDLLMLVLAFWALHRPTRSLLAAGFVLGLVMDGHTGSTLGEHAMAYTVAVWLTLQFQRRIGWFRLPGQMLHMLGVLLVAQGTVAGARFLLGLPFLGPEQFLYTLGTILLWPLAGLLLHAPVRRLRPSSAAAGHVSRTAPFVAPDETPGLEEALSIFAHHSEPDTLPMPAPQPGFGTHALPSWGATPAPHTPMPAPRADLYAAPRMPATTASTPAPQQAPQPAARPVQPRVQTAWDSRAAHDRQFGHRPAARAPESYGAAPAPARHSEPALAEHAPRPAFSRHDG